MSRYHTPLQQHEILTNCEAYMSKLLKTKPCEQKRVDKNCCCSSKKNQIQVARIQNGKVDMSVPQSEQELIHKEVLNNNLAQVEVTVRTMPAKTRSRSTSSNLDKREPWAKILQYKKSTETVVNVNNYDYALGTIHFLSKELQQKLKTACPGDASLAQIVNDIQHTLCRLSPDGVLESPSRDTLSTVKNMIGDSEYNNFVRKDCSHKSNKPKRCQSTQTICLDDYDSKRVVDENYLKLESAYKQMEANLFKLKSEKNEIELQLQLEREQVKFLKSEMELQRTDKNDKSLRLIKQLREEREALEKQLKQNDAEHAAQENASNIELQNLVQKLKDDNQSIEYENMTMNHEITIMKLEKEKLNFLLESRDKQLKALRGELESIQSLVSTQLYDMNPKYLPFSVNKSIEYNKNWRSPSQQKKLDKKDKPVEELFLNKMKSQYHEFKPGILSSTTIGDEKLSKKETCSTLKSSQFQDEFPQRDIPSQKSIKKTSTSSKTIPSDVTITTEFPDFMKEDLELNIRQMFSELKRQALVALSSPQPLADTPHKSDNNS